VGQQIFPDLQRNEEELQRIYARCSDIVIRPFIIQGKTAMLLIYLEGLSDKNAIERQIVAPLMRVGDHPILQLQELVDRTIVVSQVKECHDFQQITEFLAEGSAILLRDSESQGIAFGLNKWEMRGIEEPTAESVIRGSREGFTETIKINIAQIRRILKKPELKIEAMKLGSVTQTSVAVVYLDNLADPELVQEVKNRLERIDIDGMLESGYIEQLIEDSPYSPFPQILSTERPDVVCGNLLEGRVAIIQDGTPFVLVVPVTFFAMLQAAEDYYQRFWIGSITRLLRYFFVLVAMLLPSLYVAIQTFHQEMIPGSLLFSMAASREQVPFPALIEALLMEVTFEALREAGIRLPKQVGAAVSIVGALVIGQAAVQAGLVSEPMVIVVAITGISSFLIPRYVAGIAIRMLRFPFIFLGGSLGLLGVVMGFIALIIHMSSLKSFGVPYLSTFGAPNWNGFKDVMVRAPLWKMDIRPKLRGNYNKYRQSPNQKPGPNRGRKT